LRISWFWLFNPLDLLNYRFILHHWFWFFKRLRWQCRGSRFSWDFFSSYGDGGGGDDLVSRNKKAKENIKPPKTKKTKRLKSSLLKDSGASCVCSVPTITVHIRPV
jgi:hypothetical protein